MARFNNNDFISIDGNGILQHEYEDEGTLIIERWNTDNGKRISKAEIPADPEADAVVDQAIGILDAQYLREKYPEEGVISPLNQCPHCWGRFSSDTIRCPHDGTWLRPFKG